MGAPENNVETDVSTTICSLISSLIITSDHNSKEVTSELLTTTRVAAVYALTLEDTHRERYELIESQPYLSFFLSVYLQTESERSVLSLWLPLILRRLPT